MRLCHHHRSHRLRLCPLRSRRMLPRPGYNLRTQWLQRRSHRILRHIHNRHTMLLSRQRLRDLSTQATLVPSLSALTRGAGCRSKYALRRPAARRPTPSARERRAPLTERGPGGDASPGAHSIVVWRDWRDW
jgi:hypothetical protein